MDRPATDHDRLQAQRKDSQALSLQFEIGHGMVSFHDKPYRCAHVTTLASLAFGIADNVCRICLQFGRGLAFRHEIPWSTDNEWPCFRLATRCLPGG